MKIIVVIEKGNENQANFGCFAPDVLGCVTTGSTIEETLANMREALTLYFEGESISIQARSLNEIAKDINFNLGNLILASVEIDLNSQEQAA